MRRRLLSLLLVALLFGACGGDEDDSSGRNGSTRTTTTVAASSATTNARGDTATTSAGAASTTRGQSSFSPATDVCAAYTPASLAEVVGVTFEKRAPTSVTDPDSGKSGISHSNACVWGFEGGGAFAFYSVNRLADRDKAIAGFEKQFSGVDTDVEGFDADYAKADIDESYGSTIIAARGDLLVYVSCNKSDSAAKQDFPGKTYEPCAKPLLADLLARFK